MSYISGYDTVKRLGVGGLSESVKVVRSRRGGELRVIKRVGTKARMKEELEALKRIPKHCHLNYMVRMSGEAGPNGDHAFHHLGVCLADKQQVEYAWTPHGRSLSFVLEYCDGGDLGSLLDDHIKHRQPFSEDFVLQFLHHIGKGLAFLHSGITDPARQSHSQINWNTICHLDIKPANVFLASNGRGRLPRFVLGDFGCAVTKNDVESGRESKRMHRHGTPQWFPPDSISEVVGERNCGYGWHTDIWQLGAVAAAVCRLSSKPIREQVFTDYRKPCGSRYGFKLNETVRGCVSADRARRPRAANLVRGILRR